MAKARTKETSMFSIFRIIRAQIRMIPVTAAPLIRRSFFRETTLLICQSLFEAV